MPRKPGTTIIGGIYSTPFNGRSTRRIIKASTSPVVVLAALVSELNKMMPNLITFGHYQYAFREEFADKLEELQDRETVSWDDVEELVKYCHPTYGMRMPRGNEAEGEITTQIYADYGVATRRFRFFKARFPSQAFTVREKAKD